jgi:diacylglycerol O-acyltransferase / wax synthase
MQRLSGSDAAFLSFESDVWPTHVGGLVTLDTGKAPDFGFERVREVFGRRMGRVPKFTWKLKGSPLGLQRPMWTEGEFDIDEHLQPVFVPPPAGPHEIGTVLGKLLSRRLDRRLPLWKMYYLEGLPEGTAALFSMYHHAITDGAGAARLGELMMDMEPNPPPDVPVAPAGPPGEAGSDLRSLLAGGLDVLTIPVRLGRFAGALVRRAGDLAPALAEQGVPPAVRHLAPRTPFNGAVGPRRKLAFVSVSLDDVKSVSKRVGVGVNEVLIALCSAAMERYIEETGEEVPSRPLGVMVPLSMRGADDRELTNRLTTQMLAVPTHAHPLERLRVVSEEMQRAKRLTDAYRGRPLPSFGEVLPPVLLGAAAKVLPPIAGRLPVFGNALITSVRGAPFPVYVAGGRVTGIYSASVLFLNTGINVTALGTADQVDIGMTIDPELVREPWLVADSVPVALQALMHAAGAGDPHPVPLLATSPSPGTMSN